MTELEELKHTVETITYAPGYTSDLGTIVDVVEKGSVQMSLLRKPTHLQANGFFHGGVIAGLADHAAGAAASTALGAGKFAVTIGLSINYLAPANGEKLLVRASSLQSGKTVSTVQSRVFSVKDGQETLCAIGMVTLRAVELPTPQGRSQG